MAVYAPGMYRVYVAFADGPLVASPTWTEVTAYWVDLSTSRGRSSELDDFQAGSLTITFDNRDRRFDPTYSSGPYYGNLLPRRQIKVEAVISATTRSVFRGHITSWRQTWSADDGQRCVVSASDAFALLSAQSTPTGSAHTFVAEQLSPTNWWRLGDTNEVAVDAMASASGTYGGSRLLSAPLDAGGDGASWTYTAPGVYGSALASVGFASATSSTKTVISALINVVDLRAWVDGAVAYDRSLSIFAHRSYAGTYLDFGIDYSGRLDAYLSAGAVLQATATALLAPSAVHHVAMVRDGTTVTIYVDGSSAGTDTDAGATSGITWEGGAVICDGPTGVTTIYSTPLNRTVYVDEVMLWHGSTITPTQIQALADAVDGWRHDSVDERIGHVLDAVAWPSALRDLTASPTAVADFAGGGDVLSIMQRTARSESGRLFVSADGKVTYQPATVDAGASAVAAFADDNTANAIRYSGYELELDDRFVFNAVTVTGADDAAYTALDATSIAAYGIRGLGVDTTLPSAETCGGLAERILAAYATPAVRGSAWRVDVTDGTQMLAALALELGDIVTVTRTPRVGSAHTSTVQISSIAHSATADGVEITFAGAPVDTGSVFLWGTSTWGGSDGWR